MKNTTYRKSSLPLGGMLLCLTAFTGGCSAVSSQPPSPVAVTPVTSDDPLIREELRQLDAFLDQNLNVALEAELRQDATRATDVAFREKYPAWKQLAAERPALPAALQSEPRFMLHRALERLAGNTRLELPNLRRLDDFLEAHPSIENALAEDPARLVTDDFMLKHPALAGFFDQHPDLYSVFYENTGRNATKPAPTTG